MITELKALWQEAFGDTDAFTESFFRFGFHPDRSCQVFADKQLAAALYWFDGTVNGKKVAYIYGVATKKAMQNRGHARRLMEKTHEILQKQGYSGAILVPSQENLFGFYEKLGYETCCYIQTFSCTAHGTVPLRQISARTYAQKRKAFLPRGAFLPAENYLTFLESYTAFWEGENCLLCGSMENGCLYVQEFLGDLALAPAVLDPLGAEKGSFRTPGKDKPFAMYHSFDQMPPPAYFGLPMD